MIDNNHIKIGFNWLISVLVLWKYSAWTQLPKIIIIHTKHFTGYILEMWELCLLPYNIVCFENWKVYAFIWNCIEATHVSYIWARLPKLMISSITIRWARNFSRNLELYTSFNKWIFGSKQKLKWKKCRWSFRLA